MPTECSSDLFGFAPVEGRQVVAAFDGGTITSDAGALLLGATDRAIRLLERFASCFQDARCPELIEHQVATLIGQRVVGLSITHILGGMLTHCVVGIGRDSLSGTESPAGEVPHGRDDRPVVGG